MRLTANGVRKTGVSRYAGFSRGAMRVFFYARVRGIKFNVRYAAPTAAAVIKNVFSFARRHVGAGRRTEAK